MLPVDQKELLANKYQEGRALQAEGQLHPAKALYEEVLAVFPQHIETLEMLAVVNRQLGYLDTSVSQLCQVIELNPSRDSAFYYPNYS